MFHFLADTAPQTFQFEYATVQRNFQWIGQFEPRCAQLIRQWCIRNLVFNQIYTKSVSQIWLEIGINPRWTEQTKKSD